MEFPATRVVFCKNGLEEFSLKAQQGRLIYALVLNITSRSAGTYTCGYQQKNKENNVKNSALSAPRTLSVAGACRGRCPRQQHVDSPQTEDTNYGDIQCTGVTTQDICSSPGFQVHGGNDQTPVLYLNASSAKEGETVLLQCILDEQFPPTRVVFCKNGLEEFSLKAQQGKVIYALVLNITSRSAGTYTCGYQQRNKKNWVRNSALSAPQTLSVAGAGAGETTTDIQSSKGTVLAVAAVGLVLLSAGSWFAIRKGACRGRCPRHQHVGRPQMEDTSNGEVQYSTIAHVRRNRPRPVQHMSDTTTYATVTRTQTR